MDEAGRPGGAAPFRRKRERDERLRSPARTLRSGAATRLDEMTQEGCRRRAVGGRVFDYVREQAWLARGLERHFADTLTSDRWTAWTLAEASVPDVRLERFSEGGALCRGDGVRRGLVREMVAAMTRDGLTACVVPDPMSRPKDRGLRRAQAPYIVVDDGVYYVERERDPDRLAIAWAWAGSASGQMGFVTTAPPDSAAPTHEHLLAAAARATLIVFEAYDGEGAMFFERRAVTAPTPST